MHVSKMPWAHAEFKRVSMKCRQVPGRVPGGSQAGPRQVKSQAALGSTRQSQAGPRQVPQGAPPRPGAKVRLGLAKADGACAGNTRSKHRETCLIGDRLA